MAAASDSVGTARGDAPAAGRLTVVGDVVEDIVVWTSGPTHHGTDNPSSIHRTRGGSAANVAVLAAADVPTRFVGSVGADHAGSALVAELERCGVEVCVRTVGRTGTVVVLVDVDGERTMYPDRAAAAELDDLPDAWLKGTAVLHVPAYGLVDEPMAGAIVRAVDRVRSGGAVVSVDLSASSLMESYGLADFRLLLDRLAPEVVFANADEAATIGLTSMAPWGAFVVKDGSRPARVSTGSGWTEVPSMPAPSVRDTTGAGDAFAAGYLAAALRGADSVDACRAGHRRAVEVLAAPGARTPSVRPK